MKRFYCFIFLAFFYCPAIAQIRFDQLPRDLQLYPRNQNNQAQVLISGTLDDTRYTKISLRVFRQGLLTQVLSQTFASTATRPAFRFTPLIKAEPAEYSFRVFLYKGTDSLLVLERKRIVCGDVYLIHGQSNALALPELDQLYGSNFDDQYLRNVSAPYGGSPTDMSWYPAKQPFASVGGFGLTIQRLILENFGIPTCILNGAQGGTAIEPLSFRDPANHANPATIYGNLLYRAQWAGVAQQIKAIIWKQGEAEAGSGATGYAAKFTTLYNQFREDYGSARLYVGQINILSNAQDSAANLRDFQRRTRSLFSHVESIATVGTPGYGGVHYTGQANQQLAAEQFRLIARDIYASSDTLQINSPDIKKAFYNLSKDSITLVFDEQMQMVWTNDTTSYSYATGAILGHRQQKDYFYLDGQAGLITSGLARSNRVMLSLSGPTSAQTIRYLPAFFSDAVSEFYDGPTLRNTRGMRAFSFDGVPVADGLVAITTLAANPLSARQIQLSWTPSPGAPSQLLERAEGTPATFKKIATLLGSVGSYIDTTFTDPLGIYYYRLRSFSNVSESANSNTVRSQLLVLGLDPTESVLQLYPNPLGGTQPLEATADQLTFVAFFLRDMQGRVRKSWHGQSKNRLSIGLGELTAGLYIATFQTLDGRTLQGKVFVH